MQDTHHFQSWLAKLGEFINSGGPSYGLHKTYVLWLTVWFTFSSRPPFDCTRPRRRRRRRPRPH